MSNCEKKTIHIYLISFWYVLKTIIDEKSLKLMLWLDRFEIMECNLLFGFWTLHTVKTGSVDHIMIDDHGCDGAGAKSTTS